MSSHLKKPLTITQSKNFTKIKEFLLDNAKEIQEIATQQHKQLLDSNILRTEYLDKYANNHIMIVQEIANNLTNEERGTEIFQHLGEQTAKESLNDGLTLEEAVNGTIFLKQAVWHKLKEENLLEELSVHEFYYFSTIIGNYSDIVASKIAFTYHGHYLQQSRKADQRKDEFIGMASHELKTPVTSIKAYLQLLQKKLQQKKAFEFIDQTEKMNQQIDKLATLISDLLDVSKINTGKLEFYMEEFSIDTVIRDIVENMQNTISSHRIILIGRTGKKVSIDRYRIEQVLINLINNAVKYSPLAKEIQVILSTNQKEVIIQVQDFGIGLKESDQKRIFERFYRVVKNEKETYSGFGIGLFIASRIVKKHKGKIKVTSKKGKGSTFSIYLPIYNK